LPRALSSSAEDLAAKLVETLWQRYSQQMALKRPAVAPAEGVLSEGVLTHPRMSRIGAIGPQRTLGVVDRLLGSSYSQMDLLPDV
jgi:hypothetical protein